MKPRPGLTTKTPDMVTESLIIVRDVRYNQLIRLITEAMNNWRMELTAGGKTFVVVEIQRCIFQGDALSPFLFLIVIIPLNNILRKCYKYTKLWKKFIRQKYMDMKLIAKNAKDREILLNI